MVESNIVFFFKNLDYLQTVGIGEVFQSSTVLLFTYRSIHALAPKAREISLEPRANRVCITGRQRCFEGIIEGVALKALLSRLY